MKALLIVIATVGLGGCSKPIIDIENVADAMMTACRAAIAKADKIPPTFGQRWQPTLDLLNRPRLLWHPQPPKSYRVRARMA